MTNDEAQQNVRPPDDGDFDWGIRYDAALGVWVYLLPRRKPAKAAEDAASLREWFESLGTDAACDTIELPAKDKVSTLVYTPGWYAYTLANPRAARQAAADDALEEWELREQMCEQREDVENYLYHEVAGLDWRHKREDEDRWGVLDPILREFWPDYDDSWVYEVFDAPYDSDDSDDSDE